MFVLYLGNIPLRHLVYRVLDLPLSMQPLLYDFGQVTGKTEKEYVQQIVTNHVRMFIGRFFICKFSCAGYVQVHKNKKISCHPNASGLINAVTELLAASQLFMRKQQVFAILLMCMHYMHFMCTYFTCV